MNPTIMFPVSLVQKNKRSLTRSSKAQWAASDLCMQTFPWQHHRKILSQDTRVPGQLGDKSLERGIGPHATTSTQRKAKGGREVNL